MVAKLILSMDGLVMREYPINKERIAIGRKEGNDIKIENLAVSGEHAAIVTILQDSFLEDLDSTNGLEVNGIPTKKHFLRNNDVIGIGKYKLKYINNPAPSAAPDDLERTVMLHPQTKADAESESKSKLPQTPTTGLRPPASGPAVNSNALEITHKVELHDPAIPGKTDDTPTPPGPSADSRAATRGNFLGQTAVVQVLNGANAGKEFELVKTLTTLGKPGVQVAVVTRRAHGYFITHVEGEKLLLVNGEALTNQARELAEHDVIELAGIKMEFHFRAEQ
jgi:hypothetical protein